MNIELALVYLFGISAFVIIFFIFLKKLKDLEKNTTFNLSLEEENDIEKFNDLIKKSIYSELRRGEHLVWSSTQMDPNIYSGVSKIIEKAILEKDLKLSLICGPKLIVKGDKGVSLMDFELIKKGTTKDIVWEKINPILGLAEKFPENCKIYFDSELIEQKRWHFMFPETSGSFYFIEEPHNLSQLNIAKFYSNPPDLVKNKIKQDWGKYLRNSEKLDF
jgi:hypothetical protein